MSLEITLSWTDSETHITLKLNDSYRDLVVQANPGPVQLDLGPPIKKIRLGESKDLQQPLRIDTREPVQAAPAYNPQVEAISPTLPPESLQDETAFRTTKSDLLQHISKVDREITKTESQISKLKKKEQELEESSNKPTTTKDEEEIAQPKNLSLAQKIYAENRKKAQKAHGLLEKMGPKIELPLYNQPSDSKVYHDNRRKHAVFKKKLLEHLRKKHTDREGREKYLSETYSRLTQEWLRKVDKIENSQKWKAKEAKNREFFEKVFPELRKQRELRERLNRIGARIKSDAEFEEVIDGLQEQEMEDKKMRSYAVIPPLLLDAPQRKISYVNNNGRIEDFATEYEERQLLNVWTKAEIEIFKEKFLQHPKNFGVIASYLDRKSVNDCVQYYYLSKNEENYKRLLRKSRQRTRSSRNPHSKVGAGANAGANGGAASGTGGGAGAGGSDSLIDSLLSGTTGVTTRLQREQLQQKQEPQSTPTPAQAPPPAPSTDCDSLSAKDGPDQTPATAPGTVLAPSAPSVPAVDGCGPSPPTPAVSLPDAITNNNSISNEVKMDSKKKERRKEEKKKKEEEFGETTDEEMLDTPTGECIAVRKDIFHDKELFEAHASALTTECFVVRKEILREKKPLDKSFEANASSLKTQCFVVLEDIFSKKALIKSEFPKKKSSDNSFGTHACPLKRKCFVVLKDISRKKPSIKRNVPEKKPLDKSFEAHASSLTTKCFVVLEDIFRKKKALIKREVLENPLFIYLQLTPTPSYLQALERKAELASSYENSV